MLIKQPDDKTPYLQRLAQLASQSGLSEESQSRAARVQRSLDAFLKGNEALTVEMDRHFRNSDDWAVLHDLRLELAGQVVYIEHLVLNSLLEGWVIAGGQFADGMLVRAGVPCGAYEGETLRAIRDPFLECERASQLLSQLLNSSRVRLPVRAGLPVRPVFHVLVLIPPGARYEAHGTALPSRPVIPSSELKQFLDETNPCALSLRSLTRHVSADVLRRVATEIADFHTGLADWPLAHLAEQGAAGLRTSREPKVRR